MLSFYSFIRYLKASYLLSHPYLSLLWSFTVINKMPCVCCASGRSDFKHTRDFILIALPKIIFHIMSLHQNIPIENTISVGFFFLFVSQTKLNMSIFEKFQGVFTELKWSRNNGAAESSSKSKQKDEHKLSWLPTTSYKRNYCID